jgi:uncharacterized membrane protein
LAYSNKFQVFYYNYNILFNKIKLLIRFFIFRYPIALAFKIIGRCRTEELAIQMVGLYNEFINSLPMERIKKDKLIDDLSKNWMC